MPGLQVEKNLLDCQGGSFQCYSTFQKENIDLPFDLVYVAEKGVLNTAHDPKHIRIFSSLPSMVQSLRLD